MRSVKAIISGFTPAQQQRVARNWRVVWWVALFSGDYVIFKSVPGVYWQIVWSVMFTFSMRASRDAFRELFWPPSAP